MYGVIETPKNWSTWGFVCVEVDRLFNLPLKYKVVFSLGLLQALCALVAAEQWIVEQYSMDQSLCTEV